ncbi:MAG: putative integral membrane protein [Roseibaca calidilacus]|uniref:Putative integral membrane protein n=1 Tax=Roseibaca calidilacus TaxID=1666912 RepID=A0A0P7WTW4_9RHOB|nr:periplasmic heavy metal sensor [Roseibaca calidilacus]KPP90882.1 MAG: putative integral membrane protein [Roseibaca calidilacus]CUX83731.1 Uncharacterized membrane protein [Roseibaca calidilacus]
MTQTAKAPGRWKTWALVVSVTLNLLLIGMIGGVALRGGPDGSLMRAAISALPDDARRDMHREGHEVFRGARDHAELRAARAELLDALRAERFDTDRFRAGLDVAQMRLLEIGDRLEGALLVRVSGMDAAERRAMADRLEERTARFARSRD